MLREDEQFQVLFATPKTCLLEMTAPTQFKAKLEQPVLAVDPRSPAKLAALNMQLLKSERLLLNQGGLPTRRGLGPSPLI